MSELNSENLKNIASPEITFTDRALTQLKLIRENDSTIVDKNLRLLISGKTCDGWEYQLGFDRSEGPDQFIPIANAPHEVLVLDPFSMFYLQKVSVDYIQDFEQDAEGFVVINHNQDQFKGKFWKSKPEFIPPTKKGRLNGL